MTRNWRRHYTVFFAGMMLLGVAAVLMLGAFNDNLVFFCSPTEFKAEAVSHRRQLRVANGNNTIVVTHTDGRPDFVGEGSSSSPGA